MVTKEQFEKMCKSFDDLRKPLKEIIKDLEPLYPDLNSDAVAIIINIKQLYNILPKSNVKSEAIVRSLFEKGSIEA